MWHFNFQKQTNVYRVTGKTELFGILFSTFCWLFVVTVVGGWPLFWDGVFLYNPAVPGLTSLLHHPGKRRDRGHHCARFIKLPLLALKLCSVKTWDWTILWRYITSKKLQVWCKRKTILVSRAKREGARRVTDLSACWQVWKVFFLLSGDSATNIH